MAKLVETYPCAPWTKRGRGIQISGEPKTNSIAYCSSDFVVILQLDNPLNVVVYRKHAARPTVARFSPDGEWVASGDKFGNVQIWDRRGNDHPHFVGRSLFAGRIEDLQWLPDGESLAVCGIGLGGLFALAFNWKPRKGIGCFTGHNGRVLSCSFKPNPPYMLVTCGEDMLVNMYSWPELNYISNKEHSDCVNYVSYCPNGDKFISVGSDLKAFVYDGYSGAIVGQLPTQGVHEEGISSVCWCSDSKHVLIISAKNASIWEITGDESGGILKKTFICPESDGLDDMLVGGLWMKDNIILVSTGGIITIFSATDWAKDPMSLYGHVTRVNGLSCCTQRDKKVILSSSYDGTILRWIPGVGNGGQIKMKGKTLIKCFAAFQETVMTSGNDNNVKMIHWDGSKDYRDEEVIDVHSVPKDLCIALQFHDISIVATECAVTILKGAKVLSTTCLGFSVTASAIAPDGREVTIGDKNGILHIYRVLEDHTLSENYLLKRHLGPITVVKYSPDGNFIASADTVHESVVWDRASHQEKLKNLFYHLCKITCAAWSPDSKHLATGSEDRRIIVYGLEKHPSSRVTIEDTHEGGVYALTFISEDTLVSSGEDGCVCVWNITPF